MLATGAISRVKLKRRFCPARSSRSLGSSLQRNDAGVWLCEYPGLSFQRSPVCACSLVSSLLLSGATMSQQSSLTQSAHSVRQVLTAYSTERKPYLWRELTGRCECRNLYNYPVGPDVVELRDHLRQWDADNHSAADHVCARRDRNGCECRRNFCAQHGDECDCSPFSDFASWQRYLWGQHGSPLR